MNETKKTDEMFDAGLFNEYVIGAIRVTLFSLDYPLPDIDDAVYEYINGTLACYDAEELRGSVTVDDLYLLERRKGVTASGQEAACEVPASE